MEFYKPFKSREATIAPFQFPTGWNSTLYQHYGLSQTLVSIPNGMEFYFIELFISSLIVCFNSQRDGILRYFGKNLEMRKRRFNSQRDGILLLPQAARAVKKSFNSQRDGILLAPARSVLAL